MSIYPSVTFNMWLVEANKTMYMKMFVGMVKKINSLLIATHYNMKDQR